MWLVTHACKNCDICPQTDGQASDRSRFVWRSSMKIMQFKFSSFFVCVSLFHFCKYFKKEATIKFRHFIMWIIMIISINFSDHLGSWTQNLENLELKFGNLIVFWTQILHSLCYLRYVVALDLIVYILLHSLLYWEFEIRVLNEGLWLCAYRISLSFDCC